ncbi:MAG: PKD domain-containing protein [Pseudomonadota bacterium]
MHKAYFIRFRAFAPVLIGAGALLAAPGAQALNGYLSDWQNQYPGSTSDNASCQLCHGSSTGTLNAYGADLCLASLDFVSIELDDSDLDPTGSDNLAEIEADAQPGWTDGLNPLYDTGNCSQQVASANVPDNVPTPYDPVSGTDPIADANGPYDGIVGIPVTFDGTGSSDDGTIVAYDWDFGDGSTGSGPTPTHAYAAAGAYTLTLTVTDNDGNIAEDTATATIHEPAALDLDIAQFRVSKNVNLGKTISLKLVVRNNGTIDGIGSATVIGEQGGSIVYENTMDVFDDVGNGRTTFDFGPYEPTASGEILWTATLADGDPDVDEASATSNVR